MRRTESLIKGVELATRFGLIKPQLNMDRFGQNWLTPRKRYAPLLGQSVFVDPFGASPSQLDLSPDRDLCWKKLFGQNPAAEDIGKLFVRPSVEDDTGSLTGDLGHRFSQFWQALDKMGGLHNEIGKKRGEKSDIPFPKILKMQLAHQLRN